MALRVAIVACTPYSSDPRVRRHAECLAARGDAVSVYALAEGEDAPGAMLEGVRLHGLHLPGPLDRPSAFFPAASVRMLADHLRSPFDVVYWHAGPGLSVLTGLLSRVSGARVILDLSAAPRAPIAGTLHHAVDAVVTADRLHYELLLADGVPARKLHILMDAADPRLFPLRKKEPRIQEQLRVVFHGKVTARHGVDLAVSALAQARAQDPRLALTVLGEGEAVEPVRRLAAELLIPPDALRMEGVWLPLEEVATRIRDAHLAIVPHREDNERSELPSKLLEYLSVGIPVVATRTRALSVYFDESQLELVPPNDTEAMARALVRLAADKSLRKARVEAGHRWEDEYGFETQKRLLYRLVSER